MRKIISWVLLFLGAFLLVAAVIGAVWAPGQVKKTPLDVDSVTRLSGTATYIGEPYDVRVTSFTKTDAEASDDEVAVFITNTCLVKDVPDTPDCGEGGTGENADPNVINIGDDMFATDRETAEAVDQEGYLPDDVVQHEGVINKWPFDSEKRDYVYWDGILERGVPATYQGVRQIDGLDTYEYNINVVEEPATVSGTIEGFYSQDKTIWIDPVTGAIIDQEQSELRTDEEGNTLLDLDVSFTDEQVETNVDDAEENGASLELITSTVPLVGFIGGPILIIIGLLLARGGRSRKE